MCVRELAEGQQNSGFVEVCGELCRIHGRGWRSRPEVMDRVFQWSEEEVRGMAAGEQDG